MDKNKLLRDPKIMLPLLALPFFILFAYLYSNTAENSKDEVITEEVKGINSKLPEAEVKESKKSKLDKFKELLSRREDESAINIIEDEEKYFINTDSLKKGTKEVDSLEENIDKAFAKINNNRGQANDYRSNLRKQLQERLNNQSKAYTRPSRKTNSYSSRGSANSQTNFGSYPNNASKKSDSEMDRFKKQMKYIDSLSNPTKYAKVNVKKEKVDSIKEAPKYEISRTRNASDTFFNSYKENDDEDFISAVLDEGIKVYKDSRVRIRLKDDIFINEKLFTKGSYLYGTVTNFKAQRVIININSVIQKGEIMAVDISLYDNDGLEGVYVPKTMFYQFAKELGVQTASNTSSAGRVEDNSLESSNQSQALFKTISSSVSTASNAIAKALKSNKVRVKYNHVVYLVNKK